MEETSLLIMPVVDRKKPDPVTRCKQIHHQVFQGATGCPLVSPALMNTVQS